jgi:hypothetical protein
VSVSQFLQNTIIHKRDSRLIGIRRILQCGLRWTRHSRHSDPAERERNLHWLRRRSRFPDPIKTIGPRNDNAVRLLALQIRPNFLMAS